MPNNFTEWGKMRGLCLGQVTHFTHLSTAGKSTPGLGSGDSRCKAVVPSRPPCRGCGVVSDPPRRRMERAGEEGLTHSLSLRLLRLSLAFLRKVMKK